MKRFGPQRLERRNPGTPVKGGWRLTFPLCPFWQKGWRINDDAFVTGWWTLTAFISVEAIDVFGPAWGFRVMVGLIPPRNPLFVQGAWERA